MAEQDELDEQHQDLPPEVRALLIEGRQAKRELAQATARSQEMERQVAIERADIPASPMRDFFLQNYEGPADSEAIRAEAEKLGLFASGEPAAPSGPTAEEQAAQRLVLSAAGGAPAASGDIDLAVALRNAKSSSDVMRIVNEVAGTPGFKNTDGLIGVLPEY